MLSRRIQPLKSNCAVCFTKMVLDLDLIEKTYLENQILYYPNIKL